MQQLLSHNLSKVILSAFFSLVLVLIIQEPFFNVSQNYVLFLLFFSVALWLTEAVPAYVVSLFIIAYLVFTLGNPFLNPEPVKIDAYVNTFSSSGIWLIMGGFFIASAMTKTGLDKILFSFAIRLSGVEPNRILTGIMLITMCMSMFMSNTATTAMILASVMPLLLALGKENGLTKALLIGVPVASTIGGMATVIGSPPNIITASLLQKAGDPIGFVEWLKYGVPVVAVLFVVSVWTIRKYFIRTAIVIPDGVFDFRKDSVEVNPFHRMAVICIIIVTILFWLTSSIHHIPVATVCAIPLVLFPALGIMDAKDIKSISWDTLFLVAGGLALGLALEDTQLLNHYAKELLSLNMSPLVLIVFFCYLTMIVSNVMSNTAASSIMIPLGMSIMPGAEREAAIVIALSASVALLFPVSSPSNAIVYSTGMLEQKDYKIMGLVLGLLGPCVALAVVLLLR